MNVYDDVKSLLQDVGLMKTLDKELNKWNCAKLMWTTKKHIENACLKSEKNNKREIS